MSSDEHTVSSIDAVFDNDKIVVAGKLVLIDAMHAALLRRAAETVASWE